MEREACGSCWLGKEGEEKEERKGRVLDVGRVGEAGEERRGWEEEEREASGLKVSVCVY